MPQKSPFIEIEHEDEEGWIETLRLPAVWQICSRCEGHGVHDHPAFCNGITSSDWAEWDEDEREGYMRGNYDVPCSECGGSGKVQVVDVESLGQEERAKWEAYAAGQADIRAERAHMERMRARGIEW